MTTHRPLDVVGCVLRARRVADLSQRDLARLLGVSQATVSRWESGRGMPSLDQFQELLALADLQLTVTDQGGTTVRPVPSDSARDNADRRYPAHLDVVPPDEQWRHRGSVGRRYDRSPPRGWYALRAHREGTIPGSVGSTRPPDHPTTFELQVRERLRRHPRRLPPPIPAGPPCVCPIACEEAAACPESCPCACEPAGAGWRRNP